MSDKLDNLKKKYEELGKEIKRLENSGGRCRAEKDEAYFCISTGGYINRYTEDFFDVDDFRHQTRNYFKTREEAQKHLDNINTYYELMNLAEELNNEKKIDWNNYEQEKYYLFYDYEDKTVCQNWTRFSKEVGQIYCLDENFLDKALERIGKERLEKLFKNS